jgi:hypothetical protein
VSLLIYPCEEASKLTSKKTDVNLKISHAHQLHPHCVSLWVTLSISYPPAQVLQENIDLSKIA